jgi:hydrogenase small subunit
MPRAPHTRADQALLSRGVTRRDFVAFCGALAASLGLAETMVPRIARALEDSIDLTPVVWLNHGSCSGCTESLAQADTPDIATILLDLVSLQYNETLMAAAGSAAEQAKTDTIADGGYLLVMEGAVMRGWRGNALRVAGRTGLDHIDEAVEGCEAVIAVGSCAVDGGWVAADPNPADATGIGAYLEDEGIDTPVINLPTCPVNPEWVIAVLVDYLLLGGRIPDLDEAGRPKSVFGQTVHDNCPRRGHYEAGEFVEEFGSEEEAQGYCLYKMGCKGPTTETDCPLVRWNRRVSWCVEAGSPCIGCGSPRWVDNNTPFLSHLADVAGGIAPETVGLVAGGAALTGIVAHGVAQTLSGRMGHGAPTDDEEGGE